jgi:hypothetical protein
VYNRHKVGKLSNGTVGFVTAITLTGAIFATLVFPEQIRLLVGRVSKALVIGGGDGVTVARYGQISGLQSLFESAPWYGHGLSASGRVNGFGSIQYGEAAGSTGSNWFFSLLAEGKLLAIPLIATLVLLAILGNRAMGSSLLMLILVNSLFSNALYFPLTWFAIALTIAPRARENAEDRNGMKLPLAGAQGSTGVFGSRRLGVERIPSTGAESPELAPLSRT